VGKSRYVDLAESKQEALRLFQGQRRHATKVEQGTRIPDSYRLVPKSKDINLMKSLGKQLAAQPGVFQVVDETDGIKTVTGVSEFAQRAMLVIGTGLLVAALLLILNAIRMAMYARRREIEVMKLGRRHQLVHPRPVHAGGRVPGTGGLRASRSARWTALDKAMNTAAANRDYHTILEGFVAPRRASSASRW
jgi:cell division transport system permease protein